MKRAAKALTAATIVAALAGATSTVHAQTPTPAAGTETAHCIWSSSTDSATIAAQLQPSSKYADASALRAITITNYGPTAKARIAITSSNTGKNIGIINRKAPTRTTKTIQFRANPEYTIPWGSTLKATLTTPTGQRCTLTLGL